MKYVDFDRTKTELQAITYGNSDTIYFTTDTNLIVINHKIYGETDVTDIINKYDVQIKNWALDVLAQKKYVDLGLPSGILWATCNVGANTPDDYGDYFAWGETTTKYMYEWSTYKWCKGSSRSLTKYNTSSGYGTVDNKTQLELSDDAARVNWGGSWRMPTDAEWNELREHCTWKLSTLNGVYGYTVTSNSNGNNIFFPAAGYYSSSLLYDAGSGGLYWSSSLGSFPSSALVHDVISASWGSYGSGRNYGRPVRPVCEPAPKFDNTKTKEEAINAIDGVCYFTTDTHEIYINGESYGGSSLEGYATEEFVTSQGYLTEVPGNVITEETLSLKNYTTQTLVLNYVNDSLSDYITSDDLSDFGFLTEVPSSYVTDGELEEMGYATEDWVIGKGYLTEHLDISGKADVVALNLLSEKLALRELEILTLLGQVSDLQTQINTLLGYYNELENIIG